MLINKYVVRKHISLLNNILAFVVAQLTVEYLDCQRMMVSGATHGFTVTSTVMAACDSNINVAPSFNNWWQCYSYLSQSGAFVRGSSLLFRRAPSPVSKSYGLSQ
ncbi:hypothetical protein KSF78_0003944 [Schistosoma japonicum]|nr:hypothetical protein KSF78_0003944 [Schistosoma japonicum]